MRLLLALALSLVCALLAFADGEPLAIRSVTPTVAATGDVVTVALAPPPRSQRRRHGHLRAAEC